MHANSCLLVTPLNTANELVQDVKEAIKRRKRPFVVFCGILLAAQLTVVVCLAQTHLNDHVDAALSVDPANLEWPDAGKIIGSYRSFKDFNYYDWDAWFDPGSSSSAAGGFTIPESEHVPFGSPPSGVADSWFAMDVVLKTDHNVYYGGGYQWDPIDTNPPVQFVSRPAVCEYRDIGLYEAAVLGADGNVYMTFGEHKNGKLTWNKWHSLGRPPVGASSAPAIGCAGLRSDVVVRGSDGAIWYASSGLGTSSSWKSLGGTAWSAPALCELPNGRVDAWYVDGYGRVWHAWLFVGAQWSGWINEVGRPPNGATGAPTVVADKYGQILVFVPEGSSAYAYGPEFAERYWNGKQWSTWIQTTVDFYNSKLK
jgi:hypothetical protein